MAKTTTVKAKYLRISPKKVRPWFKELSGETVEQAQQFCANHNSKALQLVNKLFVSAIAAAQEQQLNTDGLVIKELTCQTGPILKRRRIRARGRTDIIKKRSSHFILTVAETKPKKASKKGNQADKSKKLAKKKK